MIRYTWNEQEPIRVHVCKCSQINPIDSACLVAPLDWSEHTNIVDWVKGQLVSRASQCINVGLAYLFARLTGDPIFLWCHLHFLSPTTSRDYGLEGDGLCSPREKGGQVKITEDPITKVTEWTRNWQFRICLLSYELRQPTNVCCRQDVRPKDRMETRLHVDALWRDCESAYLPCEGRSLEM